VGWEPMGGDGCYCITSTACYLQGCGFRTINFGSGSDFPVNSGSGSDFQMILDPDMDPTFYTFSDPDPFWILFESDIFFVI